MFSFSYHLNYLNKYWNRFKKRKKYKRKNLINYLKENIRKTTPRITMKILWNKWKYRVQRVNDSVLYLSVCEQGTRAAHKHTYTLRVKGTTTTMTSENISNRFNAKSRKTNLQLMGFVSKATVFDIYFLVWEYL